MSSNSSAKTINEVSITSESKEMEQTKETENSNSNQIQNMTNPEELLDLSKKLFKEQKYENTFEPIQRALDLLKTTKHPNDETHVDFAEYYLLYGKVLFRVQQAKNNVFGMVEEQEEEEDVEEVEPSPQLQEVPLIGDSTELDKNDEKPTSNDKNNNSEEITEKKQTENDVSDGELCWQYLELSRLCLDKFLKKCDYNNNNNNNTKDKITLSKEQEYKYNKLLSDVHSYLGDFLLEDGQSSESLSEYEKSIEILKNINGNKRDISSMHFLASIAANHNNNNEKMDYHQGESEMLLVEYIKDLLINNDYQIKENDEELTFEILKQHVNNFLTQNKDNDKYKTVSKELNEVIQTLDDLCERNDTGFGNENDEQIEGFDMNEFRKLLSQPDGLKALVTSDMMKNLKEPKIDDKENNNNSNNNEKKGVTTFGFGENNNDNDKKDEKVNELSSSCVRSKRPQKRKLNEANVTNEHIPESKRTKLNPTSNTSD